MKEKKGDISKGKHGFFAYCRSDQLNLLASLRMKLYRKGIDLHSIISVSLERQELLHVFLFVPLF